MIVAGAVADWYWTRPSRAVDINTKVSCWRKLPCLRLIGLDPTVPYKGGDGKSFKFPLLRAIHRTFRFHLGSVAFGSFLIACVQLIRLALEYLKKQTQGWGEKNKCYRIMLKIISIILICFEKCIKFITRNAFIMVAMQGHGFCDSCCHAFKLLLSNMIQFVLVSCFSKVVTTLGKLAITATSMILAYLWLSADPKFHEVLPARKALADIGYAGTSSVTNRAIPLSLVALLAYGSAAAFLHVYDLAIGTILICFCEDFKVHQVDDRTQEAMHREVYMPKSLRKIVLSRKEFKHMQRPMTTIELMDLAGLDSTQTLSEDCMPYPEIIKLCKNLLIKSDEFLHLQIPPSKLTERTIIDNTGGRELDEELKKHKNPDYDAKFAEDVESGHEKAHRGYHDMRLYMYKPRLTKMDVLEIISRAGLLDSHGTTMTTLDVIRHAKSEHGPQIAQRMSEKFGYPTDDTVHPMPLKSNPEEAEPPAIGKDESNKDEASSDSIKIEKVS